MNLEKIFKFIGLALFLAAIVVFLLLQNPKTDALGLVALSSFGCVLAISGACLVTSQLLKRIKALEERVFYLEEEIKKIKQSKEQ